MIDIEQQIDRWHRLRRGEKGTNYCDTLEQGMSMSLGDLALQAKLGLQPEIMRSLGWPLYHYHESKWESTGWSAKLYDRIEDGRVRTSRFVTPNIDDFCAGTRLPLPPRKSATQFIPCRGKANQFLARVASALVLFDHVLVEDPVPGILDWGVGGGMRPGDGWGHPSLDLDDVPTAIGEDDAAMWSAWFEFCDAFRSEISGGRLVPVTTVMPEWYFRYKSGSDLDKVRFGDWPRIMELVTDRIQFAGEPLEKVHAAIRVGLVPPIERTTASDLFWQSHYCGRGIVQSMSLGETQRLVHHLMQTFEHFRLSESWSSTVWSGVLESEFSVSTRSFSPVDVANMVRSEQLIKDVRAGLSQLSSSLLSTDIENIRHVEAAAKEELRALADRLGNEGRRSNWSNELFQIGKKGGIGFFCGSAAMALTDISVKAVIAGGLGAMIPVAFDLAGHADKGVESRRYKLATSVLASHLSSD